MSVKKWLFWLCLLVLSSHGSFLFSDNIQNRHKCEIQRIKNVNDQENILAIEMFLQRTVPGLSVSYAEVFQVMIAKGYNIYLIGGTIRDLLLDDPVPPNDVDFVYSCTSDELEALLIEQQWFYTRLPSKTLFEIGDLNGQYLQGVRETSSFSDDVNQKDFTVNQMIYDVKNHCFLEKSRQGFIDLKSKQLRVPSADWKKWIFDNSPKKRIDKIFRFWKMVAKGYSYSSEFEEFIRNETLFMEENEPEFLRAELIRYFSGHIENYEEAVIGCKIIMGREWCETNFMSLYNEFQLQNRHKKHLTSQYTHFSSKNYMAQTAF